MRIGALLSAAFAFGLIATATGCASASSSGEVTTYRATVVGRFEAPAQHLAVFDVTIVPESPPSDSMDIEVRAGPKTSQLHLIGNEVDVDLDRSGWVQSFDDHGYGGEKTYYVEITVYFHPDFPADVRTFVFSTILYGTPQTGKPHMTD